MKSLKGSQTERNLLAAFAGESQARNRYSYFASQAKKEGYEQISAIFMETADNEKEHAKRFFKFLEGGDVEIVAAYPAGVIGDTLANLKAAAAGEHHEWTAIYKDFAGVAEKEGYPEVATIFKNIAKVEAHHEARYLALAANIEKGEVFKKTAHSKWKCRNCGYIHDGPSAPELCPACQHPKAYFELQATNW
jgi:rubrerythrin